MSSYLTIKKDGVTVGCWSRSEKMYGVFDDANFGEFEEFNPEMNFIEGIESTKESINTLKSHKNTYVRMLEGNLTYEERFETIGIIKDIEEEIKELEELIIQIQFMLRMYNDSIYEDSGKNVWTWMMD